MHYKKCNLKNALHVEHTNNNNNKKTTTQYTAFAETKYITKIFLFHLNTSCMFPFIFKAVA